MGEAFAPSHYHALRPHGVQDILLLDSSDSKLVAELPARMNGDCAWPPEGPPDGFDAPAKEGSLANSKTSSRGAGGSGVTSGGHDDSRGGQRTHRIGGSGGSGPSCASVPTPASSSSDVQPPALGFVELDEPAIRAVAPVAKARVALRKGAPEGGDVLIPLFSNGGFLPFLRNLLCSLRRLEVRNYLVIAMDNATCPNLWRDRGDALRAGGGEGEGYPATECVYPYHASATAVVGASRPGSVATYRSVDFNRMVMQRPLWVRWLLLQGYSVIQCDLDIVWLHDPHPLLLSARLPPANQPRTAEGGDRGAVGGGGSRAAVSAPSRVPVPSMLSANDAIAEAASFSTSAHVFSARFAGSGYTSFPPSSSAASSAASSLSPGARWRVPDMLFQSEQAFGLNGGFYFARPTKSTIAFFDEWLCRLAERVASPSFEEQHALNSALRMVNRPNRGAPPLLYDALHERQFPNGKIWWSYPWLADKRIALIVHANWNKQQKKSRMMRDMLWFTAPGDERCAADFDPHEAECSKLCRPVAYAAPGDAKVHLKKCSDLQREDGLQLMRLLKAGKNGTRPGLMWHPSAYRSIDSCERKVPA